MIVDLSLEDDRWSQMGDLPDFVTRVAEAAAAASGVAVRPEAELSVVFTDDAAIRALNAEWRQQDKPTNVLSFPAADPDDVADAPMLGDLVVAFETVAREAEAEGKTLRHHTAHMIVHGVLHLIGFDHETDAEAEPMEALERRILATLGIADPYAESDLIGEAAQ